MTGQPHRIDVHAHVIPDFFREALRGAAHMSTSGAYPDWSPELQLRTMDRNGIATMIVSISYPGVHHGDDAQAGTLARRCNELKADLGARWPGRFGGFATLPLPDVEGAVREAAYALDVLKLDGVCLLANYAGIFLGDDHYAPLFEELNRRGAVVFVHPGMHPASKATGLKVPGFMMEFLFDTTRAAVNMIFNGTLERYPRIRFILAHAGGVLPYFSWRLSVAPIIAPPLLEGWTAARVWSNVRSFWFDTALSPGPQTMGSLREVAQPGRILFGSDWPFAPDGLTGQSIEALRTPGMLSAQELGAIERGNALALFPRFAQAA
jgi:predicted TIM-barrel fold metal-dependent hydrolase